MVAAHLAGLEERAHAVGRLDDAVGAASPFPSRLDAAVDALLHLRAVAPPGPGSRGLGPLSQPPR